MCGVCAQHWLALVAQVLLSQLYSLSPQPWSSVLRRKRGLSSGVALRSGIERHVCGGMWWSTGDSGGMEHLHISTASAAKIPEGGARGSEGERAE